MWQCSFVHFSDMLLNLRLSMFENLRNCSPGYRSTPRNWPIIDFQVLNQTSELSQTLPPEVEPPEDTTNILEYKGKLYRTGKKGTEVNPNWSLNAVQKYTCECDDLANQCMDGETYYQTREVPYESVDDFDCTMRNAGS